MLPAIAIALQLAQVAPSLAKIFGAKEPTVEATKKVIDAAMSVTGALTADSALTSLQVDSGKALEFELRIREHEQELMRLQYADVADARKRDIEIVKETGANNRSNWLAVLAIAVVFVIFIAVWVDPDVNEYVRGVATLVMGRFLGYLDVIYNFEFGYTRGKAKADDAISALSKKGE